MSWICVMCSEQESDNSEVRGFGICKACSIKAREKAAKLALERQRKFSKSAKTKKKR